MSKGWTPERRARQAELIRSWKPWEQSTGPRSDDGKASAAMNSWRGGARPMLRALARVLADHRRALEDDSAKGR